MKTPRKKSTVQGIKTHLGHAAKEVAGCFKSEVIKSLWIDETSNQ